MEAATAGLEEIKALLASNPILAAPNVGEPMLLYISATHQVVSAVLAVEQEEDGHKFPLQKPVYYVSTVLTPCKSRYPHYQNYHHGSVHFHDDKSRVTEVLSSGLTDTWHPP